MAHTYGWCLYHVVFSTHERCDLIQADWRERLWAYIGGTARNKVMNALCVGGTANHIHLLIMMPPALAPAKGVQLIKGNASRWINDTFAPQPAFAWQEGYGVFSVSFSQVDHAVQYIERQDEHHRRMTFEDEYRKFLVKHGITAREQDLFG